MKRAVVCGSGGFIGSHLVRRLKREGYYVVGLSRRSAKNRDADEAWTIDLCNIFPNEPLFANADICFQLACEVGGLGYISDRTNDAEILHNSTMIDLNVLEACVQNKVPKIFFASSACVYNIPGKRFYAERDAYPANCSNEFAWQKLYAERLYQAYARYYGIAVRIGRLFNTYGPDMPWNGGREKSVAALCRKVAEAEEGGVIEVWGSGEQTRSYTYVDDAVEGIWRLANSTVEVPINIGPVQETSIRDLVRAISSAAGKDIFCKFGGGPTGVSKICSDNTLIKAALGWEPTITIEQGLETAYEWVEEQVNATR